MPLKSAQHPKSNPPVTHTDVAELKNSLLQEHDKKNFLVRTLWTDSRIQLPSAHPCVQLYFCLFQFWRNIINKTCNVLTIDTEMNYSDLIFMEFSVVIDYYHWVQQPFEKKCQHLSS